MKKTRTRELTVKDIAKVLALGAKGDRTKVFKAVERLAKETCGFTMFTILKYLPEEKVVERVHTSNRKSYPVGGRKPIDPGSVNQRILDRGKVFVAADKAAIKRTYFDYELIYSLGITAILNAPISLNGKRLGTLALSGLQGMYGPKQVERAAVLSGLLAPAMIADAK